MTRLLGRSLAGAPLRRREWSCVWTRAEGVGTWGGGEKTREVSHDIASCCPTPSQSEAKAGGRDVTTAHQPRGPPPSDGRGPCSLEVERGARGSRLHSLSLIIFHLDAGQAPVLSLRAGRAFTRESMPGSATHEPLMLLLLTAAALARSSEGNFLNPSPSGSVPAPPR